jgi:hypothetical protein
MFAETFGHIIPDLNPCDFFGVGGECLLKGVFAQKPTGELEMRGLLAELYRWTEEDL